MAGLSTYLNTYILTSMSDSLEARLQARVERYAAAVGKLDAILNHEAFDSLPADQRLARAREVLAKLGAELEVTS